MYTKSTGAETDRPGVSDHRFIGADAFLVMM
jgi:hypothetical protein